MNYGDVPFTGTVAATIANQATLSGVLPMWEGRTALMQFGSTMTNTAVTFQGAYASDGTFATIENGSGASLSANITNAPNLVPIPAAALTMPFLKLKFANPEGASRSVTIIVKS